MDLASIASILKFSDTLKSEFQEIYALVNNAQIIFHPHTITEDGFEITYQTNYLGKSYNVVKPTENCSLIIELSLMIQIILTIQIICYELKLIAE